MDKQRYMVKYETIQSKLPVEAKRWEGTTVNGFLYGNGCPLFEDCLQCPFPDCQYLGGCNSKPLVWRGLKE